MKRSCVKSNLLYLEVRDRLALLPISFNFLCDSKLLHVPVSAFQQCFLGADVHSLKFGMPSRK